MDWVIQLPCKQDLFIEIVSVTSPIGKGDYATLIAQTLPNANCDITVYYKSGPSSAQGLYPKKADNEDKCIMVFESGY